MKQVVYILFFLIFFVSCRSGKETTVSKTKTDIVIDSEYKKRLAFLIDSLYTDRSKKTTDEKTNWNFTGTSSDNSFTMDRFLRFDYPRDNSGQIIDSLKPFVNELFERNHENKINTQTSESLKKSVRTEIENNLRKEFQSKYDESINNFTDMYAKLESRLSQEKKYSNPFKTFSFGFLTAVALYIVLRLALWFKKKYPSKFFL